MNRYLAAVLIPGVTTAIFISCERSSNEEAAATPQAPKDVATIAGPSPKDEAPVDMPGLHNVVAYVKDCYSGSSPEGDVGFATLAAMGVRTIISVDGAAPQVEAAAAHGIRYIHLPIGYNGFDEKRKLELARATRDGMEQGPVYIHCHHGKHRSAGAAAAAAVSLGWASPEEMVARMKVSGTAPSYTGLYACAAESTPIDAARVDAVPADFPSISKPAGLVKAMVEVDFAAENLKVIQKARWVVPADHPDLVPPAEAGRLRDLFRFLETDERALARPADFMEHVRESGRESQALEEVLAAAIVDPEQADSHFAAILASCRACHVDYRD